MNLEIRAATPADAPALLPLVVEMGVGFHHPPRADEALIGRYLRQDGYGILLAVLNDEVVGFLAYTVHLDLYMGNPTGEIVDMLVTEPVRGMRIGSALVEEAMRIFKEAGCSQAQVITGVENEPAKRAYKKAGLVDELLCLQRHFVDEA